MKLAGKSATLLAFLGPTIALHAYAEIYMSESDAAGAIFPGQSFVRKDIELTKSDIDKIEAASEQKIRSAKSKYFRSENKEVVFIDQVLGKHEFITYAVGIKPDGKVAGVEIIEYRESYGQQVRKPEWRKQFEGKDVTSKFKLNDDIQNLSGATLSSAHVTAGVKRILETYSHVKDRL
jgi:Na+-translocating ferredoxin:NAD+ oxidoreductase RnfG subunit